MQQQWASCWIKRNQKTLLSEAAAKVSNFCSSGYFSSAMTKVSSVDGFTAWALGCLSVICRLLVNPLIATLKPQSNGPSYSNKVIGTLAVDGWALTFGTARRGLGGATARPGPSLLYQM